MQEVDGVSARSTSWRRTLREDIDADDVRARGLSGCCILKICRQLQAMQNQL